MKRRILAAALTVFMLLTLLPTTVFAEDPNTVTSPQDNGSAVSTEESGNVDVPEWDPSSTHYTSEHDEKVAWEEADQLPSTPGNYYLTTNVTLSATWSISESIHLDLNGYSVTLQNEEGGSVISISSGTLTLCDSVGTGVITGGNATNGGGVLLAAGATLNMYGGSITGNTASKGGGVSVPENATFNMYGGSVIGNDATDYYTNSVDKAGTFNQQGGTVGGTWGGIDWIFAVTAENGMGELTITPTTGTPELNPRLKNTVHYEVGHWREGVLYNANGVGVDVLAPPYNTAKVISLKIEEGVIEIGSFAAQGMPATGELVIPSTVTRIGQEAFMKSKFTKLTFATKQDGTSDLRCIAQGAFKQLPITSVELPEGLVCIHPWVFTLCQKLERVTIPSTVTSMSGSGGHIDYNGYGNSTNGDSAVFAACPNLSSITFANETVKNNFLKTNVIGTTANGTSLKTRVFEASTGLTGYADLQDAIEAATTEGGTVTLVNGFTVAAAETVIIPANVTVDLNGKTLTNAGTIIALGEVSGTGTLANNGTYASNRDNSIGENVTFTGNDVAPYYTISYELGGGSIEGTNPTYYIGTDIVLINPTRIGYTFTGWSGTGLSGNDNMSVTVSQIDRDQSFTANWTPTIYNVELNVINNFANSGTYSLDKSTAIMGEAVTVTIALNPGYVLKNIGLDADDILTDNGDGTYTFTMPARDVTVEAELLAVAQVGDTKYANIDDAIAAWTPNSTLTLLSDVTLTSTITLLSTEHHILNLSTYTITAAEGKNAFEIKANGTGSSERNALTIHADATNPGGINAGKKSVVYYSYSGISSEDRPIISITGGVFTGSTSTFGSGGIYFKGTAARKCATVNISGGTFNCSILGATKSKLIISGGTFNYSVSSQGDSTCHRRISGGTFKSLGFMTADAANKFTVGTSMGSFNVGLYVDDNGYLVVGGPVITAPGDTFKASATYSSFSSYLQHSSAAANQLYYTSVKEALADNNKTTGTVTVYDTAIDLSDINYKGTIVVPETNNSISITFAEGTTPAWSIKLQNSDKLAIYTETTTDENVTRTYSFVQTSVNIADSGAVQAGEPAEEGKATLTAEPEDGYYFVNWTSGEQEVSTDATYSFDPAEVTELRANFALKTPEAVPTGAFMWPDKLVDLVPNAVYIITAKGTSVECVADANGEILTQDAWYGTSISIVKKASDVMYSDSEAQAIELPTCYFITIVHGNNIANEKIKLFDSYFAYPVPKTVNGKIFMGWFNDENFTTPHDFDAEVTTDITLWAKYAAYEEDLKELNDAINSMNSSIETLEDALASKADAATVNAAIESLQAAISALENAKDNYVSADATLKAGLEATIEAARSSAVDMATALVNSAKAELQAAIDTKADAATVNDALAALRDAVADLEAVKDNYVTADAALKAELEAAIAAAEAAAVDSATALVNNAKTELQAAINTKADAATVNDALVALRDAITALENVKDNYITADDALKADLEAAIVRARAEAIIIANDLVDNAKVELQAVIDTKADAAAVNDALASLRDAISVLEAAKDNYVAADAALKAELEAAIAAAEAAAVDAATTLVNNAKAELQAVIDTKANAATVNDALASLRDAISVLETAKDNYVAADAALKAELEAAIAAAEAAAVDSATALVNNAKTELQAAIDTKADAATVNDAIANLQSAIDALESVKNNYIIADTALKIELEALITRTQRETIDAATTLVNNAKAEFQAAIDAKADAATVNDALAALRDAVAALEAAKDNYVAADAALKAELEAAIAAAETAAVDAATTLVNNAKAELQAAIDTKADAAIVNDALAALRDAVAALEAVKDNYVAADAALKAELEAAIAAAETAAVDAATTLVNNAKAELQAAIDTKADAATVNDALAALRDAVAALEAVKDNYVAADAALKAELEAAIAAAQAAAVDAATTLVNNAKAELQAAIDTKADANTVNAILVNLQNSVIILQNTKDNYIAADAALKAELEAAIAAAEAAAVDAATTLVNNAKAELQAAIDTKADAVTVNDALAALRDAVAALEAVKDNYVAADAALKAELEAAIAAAETAAVDAATTLVNNAKAELQAAIDTKADAATVNDALAALRDAVAALEAVKDNYVAADAALKAELEAAIAAAETAAVDAATTLVNNAKAELQAAIDTKADAATVSDALAALRDAVAALEAVKDNYVAADAALKAELEAAIAAAQAAAVDAATTLVNNAKAELQAAIDTKADANTVNAILVNLQNSVIILQNTKDNYIAADAALKAELEAAIAAAEAAAVDAATTLVNNAKAELQAAIDTKADAAQVNAALAELQTAIDALNAVKDNYVTADAALKNELEGAIEAAKTAAIEAATDMIDSLRTELLHSIDIKADEATVNEALAALQSAIDALEAVKDNYVAADTALKAELEAAIAAAEAAAVDAATTLVNNAKAELQAAIDAKADAATVTAALSQLQAAITALENVKDNYIAADAALKAELEAAIAAAKQEAMDYAKEFAPYIGENGNWWIGDTDTGENANGIPGVGIEKIEKTATTGNIDTYTITLTNGQTYTFIVTNGQNGAMGQNGTNGQNGANGKDGVTPRLRVNSETRQWEVSYDNGLTWSSLGVSAPIEETADQGVTAQSTEELTPEEEKAMAVPATIAGTSLAGSSALLGAWTLLKKKKKIV